MTDPQQVLASQLEQVKARAKEVILKQKQEIESANLQLAEMRVELSEVQQRSMEMEKALQEEKLALNSANDALTVARGQGGLSLGELARIGNERESERKAALMVVETLTATQKQLMEAKKELASTQFAKQEAEKARREDVESVRSRLEREFGEEKARLTRELEQACVELNAARSEAIKAGGESTNRLQEQVTSLQEQLVAKTKQAEGLQQDLIKVKEVVKVQFLALQKERDDALSQVSKLSAEAAEGQQTLAKFRETAKERFLQLQTEKDQACSTQLSALASKHQEELRQLQESNESNLANSAKDKEDKLAQVMSERDEANQRASQLEKENNDLEAKNLATLSQYKDRIKTQFEALQRDRDDAVKRSEELENHVQLLKEELNSKTQIVLLKSGAKSPEAMETELSELNELLQTERATVGKLQRDLERAEEMMAKLAEERASYSLNANTQVAAKEARLVAAERTIEELKQELQNVKAESEEKRVQTRQFVDKMRKDVADREVGLQNELQETKQALSAALNEIASGKTRQISPPPSVSIPTQHHVSSTNSSNNNNEPSIATATVSSRNKKEIQVLEEAKTKAEVLMREAVEEANRAKRDHHTAKREVIALAKSLDKLKGALGRGTTMVGTSLTLAADRFEDALKSCDNTLEAALAVMEMHKDTKNQNGLGRNQAKKFSNRRTSSVQSQGDEQNLSEEEKFMKELQSIELRFDLLTETGRQLLPKIKEVCAMAVLEKPVNTTCDVRKLWLVLSGGGVSGGRSGESKSKYNRVGGDENAEPRFTSARVEPEFDENGNNDS